MAFRHAQVLVMCGTLALTVACGGGRAAGDASSRTADGDSASTSTVPAAAAAPIDICAIVMSNDAAALLGPLPSQPPARTEHVGFGIDSCMYVGPALSGQGAQTVFAQLTIQAGGGKDAPDMLQDDADKRKATDAMSGVGDAAKRNAAGSFVWARKGGVSCTAEIRNGLPPMLTPDAAARGLCTMCRKVLAHVS